MDHRQRGHQPTTVLLFVLDSNPVPTSNPINYTGITHTVLYAFRQQADGTWAYDGDFDQLDSGGNPMANPDGAQVFVTEAHSNQRKCLLGLADYSVQTNMATVLASSTLRAASAAAVAVEVAARGYDGVLIDFENNNSLISNNWTNFKDWMSQVYTAVKALNPSFMVVWSVASGWGVTLSEAAAYCDKVLCIIYDSAQTDPSDATNGMRRSEFAAIKANKDLLAGFRNDLVTYTQLDTYLLWSYTHGYGGFSVYHASGTDLGDGIDTNHWTVIEKWRSGKSTNIASPPVILPIVGVFSPGNNLTAPGVSHTLLQIIQSHGLTAPDFCSSLDDTVLQNFPAGMDRSLAGAGMTDGTFDAALSTSKTKGYKWPALDNEACNDPNSTPVPEYAGMYPGSSTISRNAHYMMAACDDAHSQGKLCMLTPAHNMFTGGTASCTGQTITKIQGMDWSKCDAISFQEEGNLAGVNSIISDVRQYMTPVRNENPSCKIFVNLNPTAQGLSSANVQTIWNSLSDLINGITFLLHAGDDVIFDASLTAIGR